MLRTLGIAALAGALTAPLLAAPAAAVEPAPEGVVAAVAPTALEAGRAGDGLAEVQVSLPLGRDGRELPFEVHEDEHHAASHQAERAGVLALPSRPEMLLLEDVPGLGKAAMWTDRPAALQVFIDDRRYATISLFGADMMPDASEGARTAATAVARGLAS